MCESKEYALIFFNWMICKIQLLQFRMYFWLLEMVSVKYNTDSDEVSFARTTLENDLVDRSFSSRFWSIFSKRKFQGAILNNLLWYFRLKSLIIFIFNLDKVQLLWYSWSLSLSLLLWYREKNQNRLIKWPKKGTKALRY